MLPLVQYDKKLLDADLDDTRMIGVIPEPTEHRAAEDDGDWITINGAHVLIKDGKIEKGPKELIGKSKEDAINEALFPKEPQKYNPNDIRVTSAINSWQVDSTKIAEKISKSIKTGKEPTGHEKQIINGIRNENVSEDVHRGLAIKRGDPITKWKEGTTVQIMPSSFTKDSTVAEHFSTVRLQRLSKDDKGIPVVFAVHGGVSGMDIGSRGSKGLAHEKEVITGGRFKVERIESVMINSETAGTGESSIRGFRIHLKQKGVF